MSDHLPECPVTTQRTEWGGRFPCFCVELRAAERRAIAAMREPGRIRVLVEEVERQGFHRGYRTAVDYWRTVSTRYGKRKYREGREDAARDVEALRNRWNGQHDVVQLTAAVAAARRGEAMTEHDPLCEDSEGLPRYRQCVCLVIEQATMLERWRIKSELRKIESELHWLDAVKFVRIVEDTK